MVQQQRRRVDPGQLVRGRVRVRNNGNVPLLLGVRAVSGTPGLFGFAPGAVPVTASTPELVRPGESADIRLALRVPEVPGEAAFRLEVGTFDPTGQLSRILDTQIFSGLAEVLEQIPVTPPGPPVPPPAPDPTELAEQFSEGLGTPSVSASPRQVNPGQTVRVFYQIPTSAPFAFNPRFRVNVLGANNNVLQTPFNQQIRVPSGRIIAGQVDVNTAGLPEGSYGVGVSLNDPITNIVLLEPVRFPSLFRVGIPTPPAPTSFGPGDLSLPSVSIPPVRPGQSVNVDLPISNPTGLRLPARIGLELVDPQNQRNPLPSVPYNPSGSPTDAVALGFPVPSDAVEGTWRLNVALEDVATGVTIASRPLTFLVEALPSRIEPIPEIPPEPLPPGPQALPSLDTLDLQASFVPDNMRRGTFTLRATNRNPFPVRLRFYVPLVTAQTFNFAADIIPRPGIERTISPGSTTTIEQTFNLPSTLPAGNYRVSLEVIDAISGGAFAALRGAGQAPILRLTSGAPAPAPEPVGPPAPQLISVSSPRITPSTLEAGEIITGEWTLRNPLNATLRAFLFLDGPGWANGVPRDFSPGETETLRVIARVPPAQPAGRVTYGLAVRDANTQQTIGSLVRTVTITVTQPAPAPAPTPAPSPETTPSGMGISQGQLSLVAVGPSSSIAMRGNPIEIQYTLRNTSNNSGRLEILAFGQDPNGDTRGTGRTTTQIGPNATINPRVSIPIASDAVRGSWGVRVFIWDQETFVPGNESTYLIRLTSPDLFTVR